MLPDLDKLRASFAAAGHTLGRYARTLDGLLSEAGALVKELEAADTAVVNATREAAAKAAAVATASQRADVVRADPEAHARAQAHVGLARAAAATAAGAVTTAREHVDDLERRARELRARHEDAERTASRELDDASDAGLKNSWHSWWENARGDVLPVIAEVADVVADAADVISVAIVVAVVAIGLGLTAPVSVPVLLGALAAAGAVGLGAALVKEAATTADPGDMRSGDQKTQDVVGLGLSALLTFGGGRLIGRGIRRLGQGQRVVEAVDRPLRRAVSTPGKRVYIHAPRRRQLADLHGTAPGAAITHGYAGVTDPDGYDGPPAPSAPPAPIQPLVPPPAVLPSTPSSSPFGPPSTYRYVAPARCWWAADDGAYTTTRGYPCALCHRRSRGLLAGGDSW